MNNRQLVRFCHLRLCIVTACILYIIHQRYSGSIRRYHTIVSTEVHKGEESQQTIVIGIEIAILKGFVLSIPQMVYKLLTLLMTAHHGSGSNGADESDAMAQLTETTCRQNLVLLGLRAVCTVLIDKLVNTLSIKEFLNGLKLVLNLPKYRLPTKDSPTFLV